MRKKLLFFITAAGLLLVCGLIICLTGDRMTVRTGIRADAAHDLSILSEQGDAVIHVTDRRDENGLLLLELSSVSPGKDFLSVSDGEDTLWGTMVYVHRFGTITLDTFFGSCTGAWLLPAAAALLLALLLANRIRTYRTEVKKNLYMYRNVRNLGLIIFGVFLLAEQLFACFLFESPESFIRRVLNAAQSFCMIALPGALVISVLIILSNVSLIRKEGLSWRNMLGFLLSLFLCAGTLFPWALGEWLQRTTLVDVHNESGAALYIEIFVEAMAGAVIAYLECVLAATAALALRAARRMPAFDKDYILIHGSQIRKDGTLTKLLQGRADRAVEFARLQEKATGKAIVFVPSGGRGADEVISEAEAIKNYLTGTGIPAERILPEDRSKSTLENLKNSAELIRRRGGGNVAFSTTNYHVFRTGLLAASLGLHWEGIGSPTKRYFWINAFIREFIATLHFERKGHLKAIAVITAGFLILVLMLFFSNNL